MAACTLDVAVAILRSVPAASLKEFEELAMQRSGILRSAARKWYGSREGMAARHYLEHRCSVRELMAAMQGHGYQCL